LADQPILQIRQGRFNEFVLGEINGFIFVLF